MTPDQWRAMMARKQNKAAKNEGDSKGKSKATAGQKETEKKRREKVKNERNQAVLEHFEKTYGVDDVLQAWQQLLRDLGLPVETSRTNCKEALKKVYVNIHDFVEARKSNMMPTGFPTIKALRDYSYSEDKIFPLEMAKGNPILKVWLVHMSMKKR